MQTKKEIAQDFLQLAAHGNPRKAFAQYVSEHFIHHNAYFKGDAHSLMIAMEESAQQNPTKEFTMLRALEEGDLVAVHSHIRQHEQEKGYVVMHIFRFEGNKIAELWDFGQAIPEEEINENGML
ncbi:nuclear transport factor 2 family protein [Cytophagales bacterium LB-30]|uniref:Nuclear transport factor 2 family protein n=1 Tax=Shiella aurantiaca TaxID=3058365 RepID=A0ABT8F7P4_9BACT|nr:nuclear transport factor 2 family protein [Shiella aurantiaca]MDN4166480.1 nuclear transport factor 2 family protein [Shiella aurantiaca]